ncbi:penicillin-binding protein 2 [Mobilisporobacter senegalensis]|uniref:Penicillin-binding protein 2 n=1 Tax=Mobilisporobacter senegalensis TaxID=1329262 RepID=A0A3N1XVC7_9FIRM|nr:penicillin-binding transpeptidase domain-containing protein [Mobilisporobacter senegalensis]ROR29142.1 penicillin-binding protein 2 [Mobilisporobacter senegalensis]
MLDNFLEGLKRIIKSRLMPVSIIYFLLFFTIIYQLFHLQIVNGDEYNNEMELKTEIKRDLKSTRGNIRDRTGKLLAYNELSYTVTLEDIGELQTNEEKNAMIYDLIQIIEKHGDTIAYDFPLAFNKNDEIEFTVDKNEELRFKKDIYYHSKIEELTTEEKNATAKEVYDYLRGFTDIRSMFDITEEYTDEEALKIMTVRYAQFMNTYRKYLPITVAMNVDDKTVAAVKENSEKLPGVDILQETHRVYADSKYFAHILGYTGLITQEALDEIKSNGQEDNYTLTDQVGKSGIEKEYESYLHGLKGYETVTVNESNRVLEVKDTVEPVAGNDIYLTIDSDLQKTTYDLLEKQIAGILVSKITNSTNVGSKGVSAADILIPIYDVYFALINNNVIDINSFSQNDATALEKSVHQKFLNEQKNVFRQLDSIMALNSKTLNISVSDEMEGYLTYIFDLLQKKGILIKDSIETTDEKYLDYKGNKISLSEFLQHALSKNWIDLNKLDIDEKYYSTDELYGKLMEYTDKILTDDGEFNKKIYRSLVYSYKLSGTEICLLLFDQGVLKYNEDEIANLQNGNISSYSFLIDKIKKLKITPAQLALEPCSGSAVITDTKTGDVLALVSYPSYDNNKLANTVDSKYYNKLFDDKAYPMLNRPLQSKTAPGSTFKMVSATAGLEEGVISPGEKIIDKGVFEKLSHSPKCWVYPNNHGAVDTIHALEVSCNYFFYEVGYRLSITPTGKFDSTLGLEKLQKYATMYGFDAPSGLELSEYSPQISGEDSVRSAIGQGTNNYTPAQLARYVTTIANSGTAYNLTLLDKIMDVDGKTVLNNKATVYNKLDLKASTWEQLHKGMFEVVNGQQSSIDHLFKNLNVQVAGKTGTAQQSTLHPNHALFVSYAPFEKPEISVVTTIPNGYASGNAADFASKIYKYYFKADGYEELLEKGVTEIENTQTGD